MISVDDFPIKSTGFKVGEKEFKVALTGPRLFHYHREVRKAMGLANVTQEEIEQMPDNQTIAQPDHMARAAQEVLRDCAATKEFADALPLEVLVSIGVDMHKAVVESMNNAGDLLKKVIPDSVS